MQGEAALEGERLIEEALAATEIVMLPEKE